MSAEHPLPTSPGRIVSVSQPCPGISPRLFLHATRGQPRVYWADGDALTFAGAGIATELIAWNQDRFRTIARQARELFSGAVIHDAGQPAAGPRLFGGFAFRDDSILDNIWAGFHRAHFILPHYQLTLLDGQPWLTINVVLTDDDNPGEVLPDLRAALAARIDALRVAEEVPPANPMPRIGFAAQGGQLSYPMSYPIWEQMIDAALARIRTGELNKVVLSRVCELLLPHEVDIEARLDYLNTHYPNCYRFLFEPHPHHAFYGATPELLAATEGVQVRTMALAGTIRRGATPDEDAALGRQLLGDSKERHEHQVVIDRLRQRLEPLTTELTVRQTDLLQLSNVQHLHTAISGRLKQARGILPLVELLHPTPALGGDPREAAIRVIRESELVPRGWYAAPIGTIRHDLDGTFAVAIRSAISKENRVWLYAGAGIVNGSTPEREWQETALKFRAMLNAFDVEEQPNG
ncbi:MAG: isochorismate synthase MenF [Anaerolineae bacterium]